MKAISLSDGRKEVAAISAQGMRKISTSDACPNTFALKTVLAMPASGRTARPAVYDRLASTGTARKNGVDRNVKKVGRMCSLTAK
ncbi:hypothetical protein LPB73_03310 [Tardiphaga sp. 37S4]|jgi:hypothetical protein|uniref:hypothetical protein n=1 Tax=Tardiphaga sp. 37S4 TaxID=1404741 RepID=UPI001E649BB5|nr:hypothetical protein [Tardiphaga sp. 37S4]UFS76439.1 hypothetical protein LPB73_03310 [Tardiphaga sp. 37S4]